MLFGVFSPLDNNIFHCQLSNWGSFQSRSDCLLKKFIFDRLQFTRQNFHLLFSFKLIAKYRFRWQTCLCNGQRYSEYFAHFFTFRVFCAANLHLFNVHKNLCFILFSFLYFCWRSYTLTRLPFVIHSRCKRPRKSVRQSHTRWFLTNSYKLCSAWCKMHYIRVRYRSWRGVTPVRYKIPSYSGGNIPKSYNEYAKQEKGVCMWERERERKRRITRGRIIRRYIPSVGWNQVINFLVDYAGWMILNKNT